MSLRLLRRNKMSLKNLLERKDKEYSDLLMHMEELDRRVKKLENFISRLLSEDDAKQIGEGEDAKLYLIQSELNENVNLEEAVNYITDGEFEDCIKKEEFIPDETIDELFKNF
jgi:hypothetical protein